MDNPIFLVKGGVAFPLEKLGFIDRPFSFRLPDGREFPVKEDEQTIFFARKRMKVSSKGVVKARYVHRYCVGVRREDGSTEKNWIYPDGRFDVTGDHPSE